MRELSLFTGAGGGLLGTKLLGWTHVGYVEWNEYCQRVIAARIADGYLDEAPIFGDVRAFVRDGYAQAYSGLVDVVSGGFPCQPFSSSGRQLAEDDPRNMWPATRDVIRIVRPRGVLLENVTGLLASGYFGSILADLAALGFVGRWGCVSAGATGADHQRERVWIVAHADGERLQGSGQRVDAFNPAPDAYREASGLVDAVRKGAVPFVCGSHDGLADGMDRLAAIGNGQVPLAAKWAWELMA